MPRPTFISSGSLTITNAKVAAFQITTPATGVPILLNPSKISTSKDTVSVSILEDYSFTNVLESVLTPLDERRADPTCTSTIALKAYTDISASAGTAAKTLSVFSFAAASSSVDVHPPFILKPNTNYLIAISNGNGAPTVCNYTLSFTEVQ